jgi:hypothetical protein
MESYTNCSYKKLRKVAQKLGFFVFEGKKHCKIKDENNKFITMIPRHNEIKRETAKGIVEDFIKKGKTPKEKIDKMIK